jgi:hypothetical protein
MAGAHPFMCRPGVHVSFTATRVLAGGLVPEGHTELSPAAAWPTSPTPVRRSTRLLRSSASTRGPRRQACCRPAEGRGRRRRYRPPGRWPERTVGRAVTTTGPPQFQQVGSALPGASASCPATSQQRQVQLTSIRQSTGPFPPSVFPCVHPRWDVGQRGAHARQRPLRRRGRQRFLHHSRGWPLLSHRGERPSHLPAGANLRTRASGTTRSPTAELPLDVAGNHLPAAAACTTVDDA